MLYQQLIDSEISVWNRPNVQQMMDSSPSMGNPMLLVLNPLRILARHHVDIMPNHQRIVQRCACFRRPNTGDSADALSKKSPKADGPPNKTGCTTWIVGPPKLISRATGVSMRFLFGAGLKWASIQIEAFLEKTQTFLHLLMWVKQWDDLKNDMIFLCHYLNPQKYKKKWTFWNFSPFGPLGPHQDKTERFPTKQNGKPLLFRRQLAHVSNEHRYGIIGQLFADISRNWAYRIV